MKSVLPRHRNRITLIAFLALSCFYVPSLSARIMVDNKLREEIEPNFGLIYYFDSRSYNTFNIFTGIKHLPGRLEFWGFTDIHGAQRDPNHRFDLTRYFMEYRLIYPINPERLFGVTGIELEAEFNDFDGPGNSKLRVGVTYKHGITLPWRTQGGLRWRVHPYESVGEGYQVSVLYALPLSSNLKITGFADLNVIQNAKNRWVVEPQLTWHVNEHFNIRLELRYNAFEDANMSMDGIGVALGLGFLN